MLPNSQNHPKNSSLFNAGDVVVNSSSSSSGTQTPYEPQHTKFTAEITHEDLKVVIKDLNYFSSSSVVKDIKDNFEMKKKEDKFTKKIEVVLNSLSNLNLDDDKQLHAVFLFVLQSAEDYFYMKRQNQKMDEMKKQIAVKLLKRFVKNDEKLCNQIINIVAEKVKKTSFYRRNKKLFQKLFFLVLNIASQGK